jgi:hypothetical protein
MQLPGSWKVEETTYDDFDWAVLLEYQVLCSSGKTLGLTLVGYTWQWWRFCIITLLKALLGVFLDLIFRVKTHELAFNGGSG